MGKAKATTYTSKAKQGIHSLFPMGEQEPPPGKQGSITCNSDLERLTPPLQTPSLSSFFFQL